MEIVLNLEATDLVGNSLHSCPFSNLGQKPRTHSDAISPTSHTNHTSFEIQLHEIDMTINKFDGLISASHEATNQEVDSNPITSPKNLTLDENYGKIEQENPGLLAMTDPTLPSPTTVQNNSSQRKWKQLTRQVHQGDTSMKNSVARKQIGDECGWGQYEEPNKKLQLLIETSSFNSMAEATPCQDQ